MLNFLSSMLCTYRIHPFSLGNYLRTSLIIGNLMIIRVTSVEWTWLGLEWPLAYSPPSLIRHSIIQQPRYYDTNFVNQTS
jgi:hypothetical protein